MSGRLPCETVLEILNELQQASDKPSLAAFSAVSKLYNEEANKRLYSTVAYTYLTGAIICWDLSRYLSPHMATFVREFVFYSLSPFGGPPSFPTISVCHVQTIFNTMPYLNVFRLHGLQLVPCVHLSGMARTDPLACVRAIIPRALERLELLDISAHHGWVHPLTLLKFASSVSSVMVTSCKSDIDHLPQDLVDLLLAWDVKTFAVDICPFDFDVRVRGGRIVTPQSRILELYDIEEDTEFVVNHFIASAGSNLETLRMRFTGVYADEISKPAWVAHIDMSSSKSLRRVSVILHAAIPRVHEYYTIAILACLPPRIVTVDITIPVPYGDRSYGLDHLDNIDWR